MKNFPNTTDPKEAVLHVLSRLFPKESAQLNAAFKQQGIDINLSEANEANEANEAKNSKIVALQAIFAAELYAARNESKTAFAAFQTVFADTNMKLDLVGKDNWPETPHVQSNQALFHVRDDRSDAARRLLEVVFK